MLTHLVSAARGKHFKCNKLAILFWYNLLTPLYSQSCDSRIIPPRNAAGEKLLEFLISKQQLYLWVTFQKWHVVSYATACKITSFLSFPSFSTYQTQQSSTNTKCKHKSWMSSRRIRKWRVEPIWVQFFPSHSSVRNKERSSLSSIICIYIAHIHKAPCESPVSWLVCDVCGPGVSLRGLVLNFKKWQSQRLHCVI